MAAKKANQKAAETKDPNASEEPVQQDLDQGNQVDGSEPNEGGESSTANASDQEHDQTSYQDPSQPPEPGAGDPEALDPDADQEVFVLVDHNPLGLKCASVATVSVAEARQLEARGIVDTNEAAVLRGKASQPVSGNADQAIEDED